MLKIRLVLPDSELVEIADYTSIKLKSNADTEGNNYYSCWEVILESTVIASFGTQWVVGWWVEDDE